MKYLLQITSGRGPAECCWVVSQLARYLINEVSRNNFQAELTEAVPGKTSGTLSSAVITVQGDDNLADFLSAWEGSVQWIGTSMFRPGHKRKNWFVGVKLLQPVSPASWNRDEVKVATMRSSGPGGQHANKTETAIRVTHIPTGMSVISQDERSQHMNKKKALERLQQLLADKEHQAEKDFDQRCWKEHNGIERGNPVHVFSGSRFRMRK